MDTSRTPRPVALIILDGYGHHPESDHNAVAAAHTPTMDKLWESRPHAFVHTDGRLKTVTWMLMTTSPSRLTKLSPMAGRYT